MQNYKAKTAGIIITVLMMASVTLMAFPAQGADLVTNIKDSGGVTNIPSGVTPDYTIQPIIYLSVSPNPIGIGEYLLINVWMIPPLQATRYYSDFKVHITKPDGTTDDVTMNSYYGDATAWFNYVVDQLGTWKFEASYPGGYYEAGNYTSTAVRTGASMNPTQSWLNQGGSSILWDTYAYSTYYKPAATPQPTTITVQQDLVYMWPEPALPGLGQYWTRPVEPVNRGWWQILGNYPFTGPGGGTEWPEGNNLYNSGHQFTPWVTAPNSAHIVWKRQGAIGGLVGPTAMIGQIVNENWQSSGGNPTIAYQGRCYQTRTITIDNKPTSVWECYDLRTGQVYWDLTGISAPSYLEYSKGSGDVPGAAAIRSETVNLIYIGNGRLIKYDPYTGAVNLNMSISPLTTGTYYMNGFALSVQDLGANATNAPGGRYRLINWTTLNNVITKFVGEWVTEPGLAIDGHGYTLITRNTGRVISNTSYARSSLPGLIDYEVGIGAVVTGISNPGSMVSQTALIEGFKLETGALLWNTTVDAQLYSGSCNQADHGKIAVKFKNGYYKAWDLASGKLAWTSELMDYPWDSCGFGAYASQSAYGLLYDEAYSGIYAFDWDTGKIAWKFEAPAQNWESPYTGKNGTQVLSFCSAGKLADGKLFTVNSEHSPSSPVTRGWSIWAINVTTGKEVWHVLGEMDPGVIADGYMTASNSYDGYMYVFGMGKSATTVTTGPKTVAKGDSVLIEGTVLDISLAQPNTPCVSKNSMRTQMEYLHMQMPMNGLWGNEPITGVPVMLTAIAADGTVTDIGTVTSNGYYGTFEKAWTPPAESTYNIIATFAGDDSYASSAAATAVTVGPAPTDITIPQQIVPPDYTWTIIGTGIAVIIAVAVAALLILRKR